MYRTQQCFEFDSIKDVSETVRRQFAQLDVRDNVRAGQKVAVAVGSRGIHHIGSIVAAAVERLKVMGLKPFICCREFRPMLWTYSWWMKGEKHQRLRDRSQCYRILAPRRRAQKSPTIARSW